MKAHIESNKELLARKLTNNGDKAEVHSQTSEQDRHTDTVTAMQNDIDLLAERHDEYIKNLSSAVKAMGDGKVAMEMKPLNEYIVVKPLPENPFQQVKEKSGIITDLGGMAPQFKSNDTGKIEEEEQYTKVGIVMEVGDMVKNLKVGDAVFYNTPSFIPLPFFKFGYGIVSEVRILAYVRGKE